MPSPVISSTCTVRQPAHVPPGDLIAGLTDELRLVAASMLASERPDHTLQPTAMVNELWLRMLPRNGRAPCQFNSKAAFMAYASRAIRNILVDHARRKLAIKRGGAVETHRTDCDELPGPLWEILPGVSVIELEDELTLLEEYQPLAVRVFEMRYFVGMTLSEIAEWLDMPLSGVKGEWGYAQAWLANRLG